MAETSLFNRASHAVAKASGHPAAFSCAAAAVALWAISGPVFGFSETWQLVINTGTTIVTFLMVFLVQGTQNRDGEAVQAKLDELLRAGHGQIEFIGAEHLTEAELNHLREVCTQRAALKAMPRSTKRVRQRHVNAKTAK